MEAQESRSNLNYDSKEITKLNWSYNSAEITRILVLCKRKNHEVTLPMIAKK